MVLGLKKNIVYNKRNYHVSLDSNGFFQNRVPLGTLFDSMICCRVLLGTFKGFNLQTVHTAIRDIIFVCKTRIHLNRFTNMVKHVNKNEYISIKI